jgi:hypothetical protein
VEVEEVEAKVTQREEERKMKSKILHLELRAEISLQICKINNQLEAGKELFQTKEFLQHLEILQPIIKE